MDENLISWNLPNVITLLFMILILWMIGGAIGHFFVRAPAQKQAPGQPFSGTATNAVS